MTEAAVCGVIILFRQMSWGSSLLYLHGWAAERSLEIQDRYLSDCAFDAARRAKYQSLHRPPEFQSGSASPLNHSLPVYMRYQLGFWIYEEKPSTVSSHYLDLAHLRIASAEMSISFSVVDQFEIEMRIACLPCQTVPPNQHVPSSCTRRMTSAVNSSSSFPDGSENLTST